MTETPENTCATSFYNGACPVCRHEMMRYKAHAEDAGAPLKWVDISKPENAGALSHKGITQDMAYRKIYVTDERGVPQVGVDGLLVLWRAIPRWRWVARVTELPAVYPLACWLYDHVFSRSIYAWNKARLARQTRRTHLAARDTTGNPANQA
jgi:predicted DCC family thiol-disulfide oxidoreductase YuxK